MRAVECRALGPVDDLVMAERESPALPGDSVRVAVAACGVNYVDALFVQGRYQIKPNPPFVPGSEVAGTVIEVGPDSSDLAVGDRVLVSCGMGGFGSEVIARPGQAAVIPATLSMPAAACFTQSYSTALFALRNRAGLQPGETVAVLGAGGGVGLASIQVAVALGATVIGVASTEQKRAAALAAGAATVVEADPSELKDALREASGGGVDVVIDPVGGAASEQALRALGDGGRLAIIGFVAGPIPSVPTNQILLRNRSVIGVDWGIWALRNGAAQAALLAELLAMVEAGRLAPLEPTTYPLDQAASALRALEERRVVGKVALVVS